MPVSDSIFDSEQASMYNYKQISKMRAKKKQKQVSIQEYIDTYTGATPLGVMKEGISSIKAADAASGATAARSSKKLC